MGLPPGPTDSALFQTLRWQLRPVAFLHECQDLFGETFSLKFLGGEAPLVVISNPAEIKALYGNPENGTPHGRDVMLEPLLGSQSISLLEGQEHLARRKLMSPPFHGERLSSYQRAIEDIASAEVSSWRVGKRFSMLPRMQALLLEVILSVIFGLEPGARLDRMREVLGNMVTRTALNSPSLQLLGAVARKALRELQPGRQLIGAVTSPMNREIYAEIEARRASDRKPTDDVLSLLMDARHEDDTPLDDSGLRDELVTLVLAGHETTATALAWCFDLLLTHPAELQRLEDSLANEDERYLRAVITEALRLRAPLPLVGRRISAEMGVGTWQLPAGTNVSVAIWLAHTRADLYPDPFSFRPERFMEKKPDTYAWLPFGGGVRRCLGASFAELEMRVVLREVLTRCDLAKSEPAPERFARRNITLSPRNGTEVIVVARK